MEMLRLQQDGHTARILIDHPQRKNALSRAMWCALPPCIARAQADPRTRVVVVQGAQPGMFAAGADISEFERTYTQPAEAAIAAREIQDGIDAVQACLLPVVALIDGPCVGGGVALAVACDIRLASDTSRFAVTPARLGLSYHPDDLRRLVRACGLANASELLFGGQIWNAERALTCGLVNRVIASDHFAAESSALVDAIAANSVESTRAIKQGLAAVDARDAAATARAAQTFLDLFQGSDFIEGRDAFLQKRAAHFPSHRIEPKT
jgi:enoyl-CoA hydratase/carnithine racemase